jgi:hypothetical protein
MNFVWASLRTAGTEEQSREECYLKDPLNPKVNLMKSREKKSKEEILKPKSNKMLNLRKQIARLEEGN